MRLFEEFGLCPELLGSIKQLGITTPTQIQRLAIPYIMSKRDVIGESATGSGKTLAFGCGIIEQVTSGAGLQALILTPTRELTEQVKNMIKTLSGQKHLKVISIYGGVSIGPQIRELTRAEVVVATPGRFLDHLERRTVNTSKISILVLDEADRMFDMGFIDDVERIIQSCHGKRQTMFFSATISYRVRELAKKYMNQPKEVLAINLVDPNKLTQYYYQVTKEIKLSLLIHLLQSEKTGLVMIFCNTRSTVDFVCKNLQVNKIDAVAIHGGLTQNKRTQVINRFNNAKVGILVCTDVAARGLHINNVSHIYNYEIPRDSKDYVHRIGRTARAGEEGRAVNLLCPRDYENFSRILRDYSIFSINKVERPFCKIIAPVRVAREYREGRSRRRRNSRSFGNNRERKRLRHGRFN